MGVMDDIFSEKEKSINRNKPERRFLKKENCLHSRKLFVLLDGTEGDKQFEYLENHLYECADCQKYYSKLIKLKNIIDSAIPVPKIDRKIAENLSLEISEIFGQVQIMAEKKKKSIGISGFIKNIIMP